MAGRTLNAGLSLTARIPQDDSASGDLTVMDLPLAFDFPDAAKGKLKLKTDANTGALTATADKVIGETMSTYCWPCDTRVYVAERLDARGGGVGCYGSYCNTLFRLRHQS